MTYQIPGMDYHSCLCRRVTLSGKAWPTSQSPRGSDQVERRGEERLRVPSVARFTLSGSEP